MAAVAVERAMNLDDAQSHLHPFFSRSRDDAGSSSPAAHREPNELLGSIENEAETYDAPKKRPKRSKKHETIGQRTILQGFGIKINVAEDSPVVESGPKEEQLADLESDPNQERRKRQKTISPNVQSPDHLTQDKLANSRPTLREGLDGPDWHEGVPLEDEQTATVEDSGMSNLQIHSSDDGEAQASTQRVDGGVETPKTHMVGDPKPGRIMHLKGGKLVSPKANRPKLPAVPQKRGKKSMITEPASLVVKLNYMKFKSNSLDLGQRIQNILDGKDTYRGSTYGSLPTAQHSTALSLLRPTHPFFTVQAMKKVKPDCLAKRNEQTIDFTASSTRKASATTPGKIRAARDAFRVPTSLPFPRTAVMASERKEFKFFGQHPAWPTCDNVHVRGLHSVTPIRKKDICSAGFIPKLKKQKAGVASSCTVDSVLRTLPHIMTSDSVLRVPQRVITTGAELQNLVAERLSKTPIGISRVLDLHPALTSIYSCIETNLSAFDKFECETQAWTQKYAPRSASEVLQTGNEVFILKDWLERSTISAVQTSSKQSTNSSNASVSKHRKKKKRKIEDEFIVGSDEEVDELNELMPISDRSRQDANSQSYVLGGDKYKHAKLGSCVLLSGPHGSGKTAAVYAVAKELGFEVFEINSAIRRSGKDVLDKIGDMTENHLVQQVSKALDEDKSTITNEKLEAIKIEQPNVPDPQQKSMASFFKRASSATKPTQIVSKVLPTCIPELKDESGRRRRQKQSLILLEEVDVLFEEDKQFWLTVLTLTTHSKRPIVMTCNDERYVPMESLDLHAVLRFVPAPVDLAVDHLLLLAAAEGHILERTSVESLYNTSGHDLRHSIMELNFWCQMAVGDRTRGFQWMLDRYPPGIDIDEKGRRLRTASKNTFDRGMNIVSRDLVLENDSTIIEEFLWCHAWDDWQIDVAEIYTDIAKHCGPKTDADHTRRGIYSLDDFVSYADQMSASDVAFGFCMRKPNKERLDSTLPPVGEKVVASYALGWHFTRNVLNAEPAVDYTGLDKKMAIASEWRAQRMLASWNSEHQRTFRASADIINAVETRISSLPPLKLTRKDFSLAFDPLAYDPDDPAPSSGGAFLASSFDREFSIITTDLAPYIRMIAREYQSRGEDRLRMGNLLSVGGKKRQTRSAFSALDGGRRSERRGRYFELFGRMGLDMRHIFRTAGEQWAMRTKNNIESDRIVEDVKGLSS
ncbi:uncharacterized protein PV09_08904 [Verruconis gallopava]|uniref:AAA+ ATPase domain-containing protein n=1 Tax=Verruconis gallopava TaxID=253628 RepID=A0A0D1ZZN0_9PEZI|nr:uncharacterized protein PV09_08904 [Verruconis gallopava]KIV99484.1 hypothetical protein PV09_08904 [Verruconis gallopava]